MIVVAVSLIGIYFLGAFLQGAPPSASDSGAQVVAWFKQHRSGVLWSVWASTVSCFLLAIMTALLRSMLPAIYRDVYLIGSTAMLVAQATQSWFWGGLALHADRLEPATARTILDVVIYWGPVLTGATTAMITPVTLLGLRRQAGIPLWLGLLGLVAFTEQSVETITIFGTSGFTEPGGAMNLQLGAGITLLWLLAFALWAGVRGQMRVDQV